MDHFLPPAPFQDLNDLNNIYALHARAVGFLVQKELFQL
jgi:hypothetical protein